MSRPRIASASELGASVRSFRKALLALAGVSAVVNILYLTGSFYMLEVYDRVLPSRSMPTLIAISLLAGALYVFQGVLDFLRGRVLMRIGMALDQDVSMRVFDVIVRTQLRKPSNADGLQPLRDLDQIRNFLSSGGPTAFFDLPWLPFYLGICFLFHPWLGVAATVGALILIGVTLLTEAMTGKPSKENARLASHRFGEAEASRRNAISMHALGMSVRVGEMWRETNDRYLASQQRLGDVAGGFGAASKVLRMALQSAVLGVGAILVMRGEATAGIIIAGSILSARALAPAELAIANWKSFVAARQGWRRLNDAFTAIPAQQARLPLPAPTSRISVEQITIVPPGAARPAIVDVNFSLNAGQGLGVIGPSAAGKSTLARAIVGVWEPVRGRVRLDGASLDQWAPEALGRHIGYLPQEAELFAGTIAQNIARFDADASAESIIAGARAARSHDMILRLPDGYDTHIDDGGAGLSAGQRQRIGLARALFGDPFLVVLDEPNSNLDAEGEEALTHAILGVRARGGIVVVIAHRPSALAGVDMLLVLGDGRQQALGPKQQILDQLKRKAQEAAAARNPAQGPRLVTESAGVKP